MAPPRAELITWFVLQNKLNPRVRLRRILKLNTIDPIFPCVTRKKKHYITSSSIIRALGKCGQVSRSGVISLKVNLGESSRFQCIMQFYGRCGTPEIVLFLNRRKWIGNGWVLYQIKLRVGFWMKGWQPKFPYNQHTQHKPKLTIID